MSYVEHCNTHGQYHGDYCGECVEATQLEVESLRTQLAEKNRMLASGVDNYAALQDLNARFYAGNRLFSARLSEEIERADRCKAIADKRLNEFQDENARLSEELQLLRAKFTESLNRISDLEKDKKEYLVMMNKEMDDRIKETKENYKENTQFGENLRSLAERAVTAGLKWKQKYVIEKSRSDLWETSLKSASEENARLTAFLEQTNMAARAMIEHCKDCYKGLEALDYWDAHRPFKSSPSCTNCEGTHGAHASWCGVEYRKDRSDR